MEKEMKIAVLIDAENISSKYTDIILSEANALGNVIYKRIYGNWAMQNMSPWKEVISTKLRTSRCRQTAQCIPEKK